VLFNEDEEPVVLTHISSSSKLIHAVR